MGCSESTQIRQNSKIQRTQFESQIEIISNQRKILSKKRSVKPDLIENVKMQWSGEFQKIIRKIKFTQDRKEQLIRKLNRLGNPQIFGWIKNYMKGRPQRFDLEEIQNLKQNQKDLKFLLSILPIYDEFLRQFVKDDLLTENIRKWIITEILSQNLALISAFELFLSTMEKQNFIETLTMSYKSQYYEMKFNNTETKRLEGQFRQISIFDEVGLEVLSQFPDSIKPLWELDFTTGNLEDTIDNLEELYRKQPELNSIKVATLNFSSINTSPFEYHDGSKEADHLNALFLKNIQRQRPDFKKQSLGKIDKEVQERISVAYPRGFRLADDGKLANRQQFNILGRQQFPDLSTLKCKPKEQDINGCISFDFLVYLTVMQHVYKMQKLECIPEVFQSKIKEFDPKKLLGYLQNKRNQPQCRVQIKKKVVSDYLLKNNLDVLFLQQASSVDWSKNLAKEYSSVKNRDSVIIFNKNIIGQLKISLQDKYSSQLNFNNDSAWVFSDKGYLLISAHLKSSNLHLQQTDKMMVTLEKVLTDNPELKFIMGIDANHFIPENVFPKELHLKRVPETDKVPTTIKKRTYLQCQQKKSNLQVSQVKDLIITNKSLREYRTESVQGEQLTNKSESRHLIPNAKHPYDHYIVTAHVV